MKIILAVLCVAAGAAMTAFGDEPKKLTNGKPGDAMPAHLSIEVKETGTKHREDTHWQNGAGSFDKSFYQRKKITATLINLGKIDVDATVDVLWLATRAADHSSRILSRQTFPAHVGHVSTLPIDAESPETNSTWLHLHSIGEDWMSGAKMAGWLVIVRKGDIVQNYKASSAAGDEAMHDFDRLEKLLSAPGLDSVPVTP